MTRVGSYYGEPGGAKDTISEVFFDNVLEPNACQFIGADVSSIFEEHHELFEKNHSG